MNIHLIAALSQNRVIGIDGELPWRLKDDLKLFKSLTINRTVLMGRKTFESIGRPLPHRENWVLTRNKRLEKGICCFESFEMAFNARQDSEPLMVIGGGEIYRQCLPFATKLWLTIVDVTIEGDTFFPVLQDSAWRVVRQTAYPSSDRNEYAFTVYEIEKSGEAVNAMPALLFDADKRDDFP